MAEIKYKTIEECLAAMKTLEAIGMPIPEWMSRQYEQLKQTQKSPVVAADSDTPIWDTLKANYPYGEMPQEKIDCVEKTVSQLLEEGSRAEEPGLLLGKIQCGKTDTFEDIIGLAFDKGMDVAIILTKGTNALAEQTEKRARYDFRWFRPSDDLDQKATIEVYGKIKPWRNLRLANVEKHKTVIVCMKQAKNLEHLYELITKKLPILQKKKTLIVDDEADFASRNYKSVKLEALKDENGQPITQTAETTMAKISQQIDDIRNKIEFCRYLQVTATPYCLYLQPKGELNLNGKWVKPFRPRFTSIVPTHAAYIGGEQYYVESQNSDSMYYHLFHQIDQKCTDVLGHEDKRYLNNTVSSGNIYGLTYALVSFFMATAIRRIQEREKRRDYHSSALIHVEIDKKNHDWQYRVITRLIDAIKSAVVDEDQSDQRVWSAIDVNYSDFEKSNKKGREEGLISVELPSKEDVMDELRNIFNPKLDNYHVQIVNSDERVNALLDEETGELRLETAANIFIGGNILDRGITIKNMLCFFYGRDPGNFQQDTVLQHARMYGARSKEDMAVTRLHTTAKIYKILTRMNELDNLLREWFIAGKDQTEPNAAFIGFDKNIRPCATQKIKASNTITLKKQVRILPVGFWTGGKTAIGKTVGKIDQLIASSPNYANQDANGFFEIDKDMVVEILKLIESTYVYENKLFNSDRKNDIKEMLCALEYCTDKSGGKIYALHRTNRNMNRIRENGGWIDAPDDGRTDTRPSRDKAQDAPVIMFLRQNGAVKKDEATGQNIGWNGASFYWPVLMTQNDIDPVMFAIDQSRKKEVAVVDMSDFLEGIDPKEVLSLTFKGDLEKCFGPEGAEYTDEESISVETRWIKETTASRYIMRNDDGTWARNPEVPFDEEHDHGIYSLNNGQFPFILRPYKYMVLRNGRDAKADVILMELCDPSVWEIFHERTCNDKGDLIDPESKEILVHTRDTILNKNMNGLVFEDESITLWTIIYHIKKVLKLRKNDIDWDAVFGGDEE